jgi:superfamily II DNA or RNA helicase
VIVVSPTGSGKTVIACEVIHNNPNAHVLFLAHRRELIHQTRDHLRDFGVSAGIILAGVPRNHMCGVQVASIQTLHSRCIRGDNELPPASIVFIDEAHHARAYTYQTIIENYPNARIIGMTATPCRRDGRGLGNIFERMIELPQVPELIKLGFLVPTRVWAPSSPDLRGVRVRNGDYAENELAARMDQAKLVGDIVSHWHRHANRRKTIVFASSVEHSIHIQQEFVKSSVNAAHIDGTTPKIERDAILKRLSAGDLEVVTNCMVLTEGWDQPDVAVCILARPTKSLGLFRQMVGRVLRPFPGKDHALVLDHAGAVFQHGLVEDEVSWTLREDRKAAPAPSKRLSSHEAKLCECSQCGCMRAGGEPCPNCGFMPSRIGNYQAFIDDDLELVNGKRQDNSHERKRQWHAMLIGIAQERGYKPGWAAYKFKEKFGDWPPKHSVPSPVMADAEVRSWVRSRAIAWVKAQESANA